VLSDLIIERNLEFLITPQEYEVIPLDVEYIDEVEFDVP
jgi:hypothetical protein